MSVANHKERNSYVDILKAIGIISIVIGHSGWRIPIGTGIRMGMFVYSYHLMIFFFVAGFCFNKKSIDNPYSYFAKRLKSILPLYVGYNIMFVLLHNVLRRIHIIALDQPVYGINDILEKSFKGLVLTTSEQMLGAFWFLPMYLLAITLFCFSFAFIDGHNVFFKVSFILIIAVMGLYLNWEQINLNYHMQTSILAIPVVYLGYYVKCNWEQIERYISWITGMLCAVIIYNIVTSELGGIELSVNAIINPYLFYVVTGMGIYFCMSLAKVLNQFKITKTVFAYIGTKSFHIMALHFFGIKILDIIYGRITRADISVIERFPYGFNLWWLYLIFGVGISLLIHYFANAVISKCRGVFKKR